jgi:hypothetical protein
VSVRAGFTLVGFAVGSFFGTPQLGFLLGSLVGNIVDPVKIRGPSIGDGTIQTSRAGEPITLVYGRVPVVGHVIEDGPITVIEVEESQDKGGPKTVSERALKTFAILICQNGFDGPIAGIRKCKLDGKVAYDATPLADDADDDARDAWNDQQVANAKFLEKVRFYLGTDDQLPDPAIEAIRGVGLAPAYRRRAYAVFDQFDVTDYGVRVPQAEWEVVGDGETATITDLQPLNFGGTPFPWASNYASVADPRKDGVTYQYGFNEQSVGYDVGVWFDTLDEAIAFALDYFVDNDGTPQLRGWVQAQFSDPALGGISRTIGFAPWDDPSTIDNPQGYADIALVFSRRSFADEYGRDEFISPYAGLGIYTACDIVPAASWMRAYGRTGPGDVISYWKSGVIQSVDGELDNPPGEGEDDWVGCGTGGSREGAIILWGDFTIVVRAIPDCGQTTDDRFRVPDAEDYYFDRSSRRIVYTGDGCEEIAGSFLQLQAYETDDFGEGGIPQAREIVTAPVGPTMLSGDVRNGEAYWEARYAEAVAAGTMQAGLTYPADYPVVVSAACECTSGAVAVDADPVILADIQTNLCQRVGLVSGKLDVSELTDLVKGFKVAKQMTAADASRSLQDGYAYARGEWDSKIRFPKLGGPILFTITEDDLLADDGIQELTRGQGYDVPAKFHCVAFDEDTFAPIPQTAERFSPDVLSKSQITLELPIVLSIDETMRAADRTMKVAMANQLGGYKLRTWTKFLYACATDVFAFDGKRYRIDRINYLDGIIEIEEARRDRQSAYTSNLTGVPGVDPNPRDGTLTGPTLFAAMNLPSLRQSDNVPGVYVAATGVLDSWPGCVILLSVDGGATFVQVAEITPAGRVPMGYLTDDVGDSIGESPTETISVDIYGGDLVSISSEQMTAGANRAAIFGSTKVSEIVQFHDATETAEGQFDLTGVDRGRLETTPVAHYVGDQFVTLAKAVFVPISSDFAGETLIFRAVGVGTTEESNPTFELVFDPPEFILDGGGA